MHGYLFFFLVALAEGYFLLKRKSESKPKLALLKSQRSKITQWTRSGSLPETTGLHFVFITDCTAHQRWMAFNVFNSAATAGQKDPITWLRSGCSLEMGQKDADVAGAMYPNSLVADIHPEKTQGNFNLGFGIPKAMQTYLDAHTSMPNSTVLTLIEADMIFLSPITLDMLKTQGVAREGHQLIEHNGSFVDGSVGVAAHYLCCDDLGPPYILSVESWRKLVPQWSEGKRSKGWGADQVAFAAAARQVGLSFNVFDNLMVSSLDTMPPGWNLVEHAIRSPSGDVCSTKKVGPQSGSQRLPAMMHVVRPWQVSTADSAWGFSKYQVPPGWGRPQHTDGILECGMPQFAEPPTNLLQMQTSDDQKLDAWVVCTILHSLNSMLIKYKNITCPAGFNTAKALKMKVPLTWTNELLEGAAESAPPGTNIKWMKRCAEGPLC